MSTQIEPPAALLSFDLLCHHCSYNLRGLSPTSNCPECAEPIAPSIRYHNGTILSAIQRHSLTRAAAFLAGSVWMTTCSLPLAFLCAWILGGNSAGAVLLALWILAEHVLWTIGIASLSLPDHALQENTRWPRRHRWNTALAIADPVCLFIVYCTMIAATGPSDDIVYLTGFLAAASLFIARGGSVLLTGLWLIAIGRYLRFRLLVAQVIILTVAFILINVIWAGCSLCYAASPHHQQLHSSLAVAAFTAAPTLLFFAPWAALVLTRFARRIYKRPTATHAFPVIPDATL